MTRIDKPQVEIDRSAYVRSHWTSAYRCVLRRPGEGDATEGDAPDKGEEGGAGMTMRPVFVRFDGDATVHLFNPWAGTLRAVSCADEKAALTKMYALAGVEVDQAEHELGTRDAPWGARANDALSRGAHFAGFERFQKHPSTRAIVREEVAKVAVDGDALAEAVCDRLAEVIG